jgi:hypothetical protein
LLDLLTKSSHRGDGTVFRKVTGIQRQAYPGDRGKDDLMVGRCGRAISGQHRQQ